MQGIFGKLRKGKVKLEFCKRTQRSPDRPAGQSSWIYDGHNEIVNYGNSDIHKLGADDRGSFMKMNETALFMKPAQCPMKRVFVVCNSSFGFEDKRVRSWRKLDDRRL